ncbi:anaerobic ribonucleoside-triphosphate reductase activating protein [Cellulosimicrobium cellulans]|uniref:anaerobic ribonucleoside-triphosphate reductase activating protein n=1 Tax=Cellulosimicrobium cellulans TaxID=1710 RepID=UPI0009F2EE09|nr:anaerobic ribonucleoside-triphosphate reductase activating protein [Cellulosimicrobium cellulans]
MAHVDVASTSPTTSTLSRTSPLADLVVACRPWISTVDWPGVLAATVSTQGCPWRCASCHGPGLQDVLAPGTSATSDAMDWPGVVAWLRHRRALLDGVVLSGGEPTLHAGLPDAVAEVRSLGLGIGLLTSGVWPARLARLLPLVDWVGLEVKHLPSRYAATTGSASSARRAFESLAVLLRSGVDHEVRTTVDPVAHTRADLLALGEHLRSLGVRRWALYDPRTDGADPGWVAAVGGRGIDDVLEEADLAWATRRRRRQAVAGSSVTSG